MHGKIYAYKADTSEIFISPTAECVWERLGAAPVGEFFAAGQGNLYMAGVLDDEVWSMRPGVKLWKKLAEIKGMAALAAGGGRLFAWFASGELLRETNPTSINWRDWGRVKDVLSLAFDGGRVYRLAKNKLQIAWRWRSKDKWNAVGCAPAAGCLAADRGALFLAVSETGRILRAPAR